MTSSEEIPSVLELFPISYETEITTSDIFTQQPEPPSSQPKAKKPPGPAKRKRLERIQLLQNKYPGMKKNLADAALTMANNEVPKAILLLELSDCYTKHVAPKIPHMEQLKYVNIEMFYDPEDVPSNAGPKSPSLCMVPQVNLSKRAIELRRVGVTIKRNEKGYTAIPFF